MTSIRQPFTLNRTSPQARGLICWFPFHIMGTYLRDMSLYGMHNGGTWHDNAAVVPSPRFGTMLDCDGSGNYVLVPENSVTQNISYGTICVWGRITQTGTRGTFVWKAQVSASSAPQLSIRPNADGTVSFGYGTAGGSAGATTSAALTPGVFYHIATTWDGVIQRGYLNGKQDGTDSSLSGALIGGYTDFGLGAKPSGGSAAYTQMADVRIYNRALSAAEIWQQYAYPWDLYAPLGLRAIAPAPAAAVSGSPWYQYMQQAGG